MNRKGLVNGFFYEKTSVKLAIIAATLLTAYWTKVFVGLMTAAIGLYFR